MSSDIKIGAIAIVAIITVAVVIAPQVPGLMKAVAFFIAPILISLINAGPDR